MDYIKDNNIKSELELRNEFSKLRSDSATDFQRDYASHEFSRWIIDEGYETDIIESISPKVDIDGFKGTKGTWEFAHREDNEGMYSTEVFCENGKTIATLAWYAMPPKKEIINGEPKLVTGTYREPNALLISKAPELLYNAQMHVDSLDLSNIEFYNKYGFNVAELMDRTRTLIKESTEL